MRIRPTITARRRAQLRKAKCAQRARERSHGLVQVQLTVPRGLAAKLYQAHRQPGFPEQLDRLLDGLVVRLADYPMLKELAWGLHDEYLPAREAFALYERNWRYVDRARLADPEKTLIRHLTDGFGGGIFLDG